MSGRKLWTPGLKMLLQELRAQDYPLKEIARRMGMSESAIKGASHNFGINEKHQLRLGPSPKGIPPSHPKITLDDIDKLFPKYDTFLKVNAKDCIIVSDLHLPYMNVPMWERVKAVAKKEKIKVLIVAGDIANEDAFSIYAAYSAPGSWRKEHDILEDFFLDACAIFDEIYIIMGNHDLRFFKILNGEVKAPNWFKMFSDQVSKKIFISDNYRFLRLNGNIDISHPKQYWANAPSLPKRFNSKYLRHQIVGHSHHFGFGFDVSGQFWALEMPTLVDQERCEYSATTLDTHSAWNQGFIAIRNYQHPEIYVDGITDWRKVLRR